jgi:hypothetical protein
LKPGSLPGGLKIAVKTSLDSERRTFVDVVSVDPRQPLHEIRLNSQDNMLSLLKRPDGIRIAICVCMYSETKPMLKKTLAGIGENIANMVAYEGVNPDEIGVFVMMDGIEKVDHSILSYFEELERSSNINLG